MRQVETDASLPMPQGTKPARDAMGPPRPAFSFQRSSLTSASAGRRQSHIKLSEDPKVPVRSVNSSIVPAQKAKRNTAPRPVVGAVPPAGSAGTVTPFRSVCSVVCGVSSEKRASARSGPDDGIVTETADHIKGAVRLNRPTRPASKELLKIS